MDGDQENHRGRGGGGDGMNGTYGTRRVQKVLHVQRLELIIVSLHFFYWNTSVTVVTDKYQKNPTWKSM